MEVLRDTDGSILWNLTPGEREEFSGIESLSWQEIETYFMSPVRSRYPQGHFVFMENFDGHTGEAEGFCAERIDPIRVQAAVLPAVPLPPLEIQLPQSNTRAIPIPDDLLDAALASLKVS
jgi:hypothetical protein